jgi:hypothetical protein
VPPGTRWPRRDFGAVSARGVSTRRKVEHEAGQETTFVKFLIKLFSKSLWGVGQSPTACMGMRKAWILTQGKKPKGLMNNE